MARRLSSGRQRAESVRPRLLPHRRALRIEPLEARLCLSMAELVGHWTFDNDDVNGDTVVDSASDFDGMKKNGGPTTGIAGVLGQAAAFAGGANNGNHPFVDLGAHASDFGTLATGTISAWVTPARLGAQQPTDVFTIFSVSNSAVATGEMRLFVNNSPGDAAGKLSYGVRGGTGTAIGHIHSATNNLFDGQWHHVAVTVGAGQDARIYIDGNLEGSATRTFMTGLSANASAIGRNKDNTAGGGQWFFRGGMDDVGLWNDALTSAEVSALVNLAQHPQLNYDLGQAEQLFNLSDAGSGSVIIQGQPWHAASGLAADPLGEIVQHGDGTLSMHLGDGKGVRTPVPILVMNADTNGPGSLRAAVALANTKPEADLVRFDASLSGETIPLGGTELVISDALSIDAMELSENPIIDAQRQSRVFLTSSGNFDVTIAGLTVTGGQALGFGGAILSQTQGTLTLANSTVRGSSATGSGGGIWASGDVTLNQSTVSGNSTAGGGGGIGAGGSVTLTQSTVTGNVAESNGGGISAGTGAAVANVTLNGSIVAGNTAKVDNPDLQQQLGTTAMLSVNYSLIGDTAGLSQSHLRFIAEGTGNQLNVDPLLGPLADNGGRTFTHALLPGSPATDAGNPNIAASPEFDQRGAPYPRVTDGDGDFVARIDIGAVESLGLKNPSFEDGGGSRDAWSTFNTTGVDGSIALDGSHSVRVGADPNGFSGIYQSVPIQGGELLVASAHAWLDDPILGGNNFGELKLEFYSVFGGQFADRLDEQIVVTADTTTATGTWRQTTLVATAPARAVEARLVATIVSSRPGEAIYYDALALREALVVDTLVDESDGDFSSGDFSLREAIQVANAGGGADLIVFRRSLSGGTIELAMGQMTIAGAVTIDATGLAAPVTIDAEQTSRIFSINGPGNNFDVTLAGLTLTGGESTESGGAIRSLTTGELFIEQSSITDSRVTGASENGGGILALGPVTLLRSTLSGNTSQQGAGGGILALNYVTLTESTVSGNTAGAFGGGIAAAAATITRSTISDNDAALSGGGVFGTLLVALNQSTVSGNSAGKFGGGIDTQNETTLNGSIVAGNTAVTSPDLSGDVSAEYSLVGDGSGAIITDNGGNQVGSNGEPVDPLLGPLADNGGPTLTYALMPDSPAIDAGNPNVLFTPNEFDQRGAPFARVFNGDGVGGARIDIGAYERQTLAPALFVVTTELDELDYANGNVSLREAINSSNGSVGPDTITFAPSLSGRTLLLTAGQMTIAGGLTIDATPLVVSVTIDAQQNSRIFDINGPGNNFDVTIAGLALTAGQLTGNNQNVADRTFNGGAIRSFSTGELRIDQTSITDSHVAGNFTFGGGIFSVGDVTLTDSTVSGNSAQNAGGGISARFRYVTLTQSTVSGNSAADDGGGIHAGGVTLSLSTVSGNSAGLRGGGISGAEVTLTQSTVSGNSAGTDGGGISSGGSVTLTGSIVAGNTADSSGPDLFPFNVFATAEYSLIGDGSLAGIDNTEGTNQIGTSEQPIDPLLGPLADNGGATLTHALLHGSPAIDAGDQDFMPPPNFDQRGLPRVADGGVHGARIDVGAFEAQAPPPVLLGDYNLDGRVGAADYVLWRNALGATGVTPYSGADGNGDGEINAADYDVWIANFGNTVVPIEPAGNAAVSLIVPMLRELSVEESFAFVSFAVPVIAIDDHQLLVLTESAEAGGTADELDERSDAASGRRNSDRAVFEEAFAAVGQEHFAIVATNFSVARAMREAATIQR